MRAPAALAALAVAGLLAVARILLGRSRRRGAVAALPAPRELPSSSIPSANGTSKALLDELVTDPVPTGAGGKRLLDAREAPELDRIRAAWRYIPEERARPATTTRVPQPGNSGRPVDRSRPPRRGAAMMVAALALLVGAVAAGLTLRAPSPPPARTVAGTESSPQPRTAVQPSPTVISTTQAPPAQAAAQAPEDTVRAYYARAAARDYAAAAALWRSRDGQPAQTTFIASRFANTQAITVNVTGVTRTGSDTATVSANIEELASSGTQRYEVVWELIRIDGRWLLDSAVR